MKRWVAQQRREGHVRSHPKAGGTTSRITAVDREALLVAPGDPTAGELTATLPEVAKRHGESAQTIYSWRKHFGTLEPADVKHLGE